MSGDHSGPDRPPGRPLETAFFARPAELVAAELIGAVLWRDGVGGGRIVEVEAYLPEDDPACHGARGLTPGNADLFSAPGTIYVYINYGIHHLLNVSTGREGAGTGVLFRALEPLGDVARLLANRGRGDLPSTLIASGPGRLGQALGVNLSLSGRRLGGESGLWILEGDTVPVERTPRIGVGGGAELPLRYILPGSRFLSRAPRRGIPLE